MNNIIDINSYSPDLNTKYFFDANIWIYILCPIGNYNQNETRSYSLFWKKTLGLNNPIQITSLMLSEIINVWQKADYNQAKKNNSIAKNTKYKTYRQSNIGNNYTKTVQNMIKNSILKSSTLLNDNADRVPIVKIIDNIKHVDFNDSYYHSLAQDKNLTIVTHDADFTKLDTGINILTANPKMLS